MRLPNGLQRVLTLQNTSCGQSLRLCGDPCYEQLLCHASLSCLENFSWKSNISSLLPPNWYSVSAQVPSTPQNCGCPSGSLFILYRGSRCSVPGYITNLSTPGHILPSHARLMEFQLQ